MAERRTVLAVLTPGRRSPAVPRELCVALAARIGNTRQLGASTVAVDVGDAGRIVIVVVAADAIRIEGQLEPEYVEDEEHGVVEQDASVNDDVINGAQAISDVLISLTGWTLDSQYLLEPDPDDDEDEDEEDDDEDAEDDDEGEPEDDDVVPAAAVIPPIVPGQPVELARFEVRSAKQRAAAMKKIAATLGTYFATTSRLPDAIEIRSVPDTSFAMTVRSIDGAIAVLAALQPEEYVDPADGEIYVNADINEDLFDQAQEVLDAVSDAIPGAPLSSAYFPDDSEDDDDPVTGRAEPGHAAAIVERMRRERLLVMASRDAAPKLTAEVERWLAGGRNPAALLLTLEDHPGVDEIFANDSDVARIEELTRPSRIARRFGASGE